MIDTLKSSITTTAQGVGGIALSFWEVLPDILRIGILLATLIHIAVKIKKAGLTGVNMPEVELTSPGCVCECGSTDGARDPTYDFSAGKMIIELYCGHTYEMDIPGFRRIS